MTIQGTAYLVDADQNKTPAVEGQAVAEGDIIEVGEDSFVDIAFDPEWKNVSRLEEGSRISIRSLQNTELDLTKGSIYSKLKNLPRESSFEVRTPTAIAGVRGSEFYAAFDGSESEVLNYSDSDVYVYGLDDEGRKADDTKVILAHSQRTQVLKRPIPPHPMPVNQIKRIEGLHQSLGHRVFEVQQQGRIGRALPPQGSAKAERAPQAQANNGQGPQNQPSQGDIKKHPSGEIHEPGKPGQPGHKPPLGDPDMRPGDPQMKGRPPMKEGTLPPQGPPPQGAGPQGKKPQGKPPAKQPGKPGQKPKPQPQPTNTTGNP